MLAAPCPRANRAFTEDFDGKAGDRKGELMGTAYIASFVSD